MKMSIAELDAEIRRLEERIALERSELDDAVNGCTNSVRELMTSPKTLLALTGVGFALGKAMFSGKSGSGSSAAKIAKPVGALGLIGGVAGTALSLMGPKFGVGSVARWAISRALSKKRKPGQPPVSGIS